MVAKARHVRENLIPILEPKAATANSQDLFRMLRRSSLRCDQRAPTEAPKEDVIRWQQERQDILSLRRSNDERKGVKIRTILHSLDTLQTKENRQRYFEDANTLRMLGHTTEDLVRAHGGRKITTTKSISNEISCSLKVSDGPPPSGQESRYIDLLLKYLDDTRYESPMCFLCSATFESWGAVWKHSNKNHASDAQWPLDCPECQREGNNMPLQRVQNLGEWCGYVHESHASSQQQPFRCLLGYKTFDRVRDLKTHLQQHDYDFWTISEPVDCPECQKIGTECQIFTDPTTFRGYLDEYGSSANFPPLHTQLHTCLLCKQTKTLNTSTGLLRYTTVVHAKAEKTFTKPFACPECCRLAQDDSDVHDEADWSKYVAAYHGSASAPNPTALISNRCPLCDKHLLNERQHFWTAHVS